MVRIEKVTPEWVKEFRAVRLSALADTPWAFGSTHAKEAALTDEDWLKRSTTWATGKSVTYLALEERAPCGIIAGKVDDEREERVHVLSMWVAPELRRGGLATRLLGRVELWARERGARELRLMVTSKNDAAIRFYGKCGFVRTGHAEPYPHDPKLVEYEMTKAMKNDAR